MDKIYVGYKKINGPIQFLEVENSLKTFQKLVDGFIEVVPFENGLHMVLDEEGLIKEKSIHFAYKTNFIIGDIVFIRTTNKDFSSINDEDILFLQELFSGKY